LPDARGHESRAAEGKSERIEARAPICGRRGSTQGARCRVPAARARPGRLDLALQAATDDDLTPVELVEVTALFERLDARKP